MVKTNFKIICVNKNSEEGNGGKNKNKKQIENSQNFGRF